MNEDAYAIWQKNTRDFNTENRSGVLNACIYDTPLCITTKGDDRCNTQEIPRQTHRWIWIHRAVVVQCQMHAYLH